MRRLRLALLALCGLAMPMALFVPMSPASATGYSKTVCTGFTACAKAGQSSHGYSAVYKNSFWSMTPGHNCTNYTSYMLTHNGRMTVKPGGTGGANVWNDAARAAGVGTYKTPRVGDIAYWEAKYHGAGSGGHVAYVEAVRSDGSILISEDNLGGDFRVRSMSANNSIGWPSGFIHYLQAEGSPVGKVSSVVATGGKVTFTGSLWDPDAPTVAGRTGLLNVVWGSTVAKTAAAAATEGFSVSKFGPLSSSWSLYMTTSRRGPQAFTLYGVNQGKGTDTRLGTYNVVIPYRMAAKGAMYDSTVRTRDYQYIRATVTNLDKLSAYGTGTVTIKEGSAIRARVTLKAANHGALKIRLPRSKKGTHYYTVYFQRNSGLFDSAVATSRVKVSVRS